MLGFLSIDNLHKKFGDNILKIVDFFLISNFQSFLYFCGKFCRSPSTYFEANRQTINCNKVSLTLQIKEIEPNQLSMIQKIKEMQWSISKTESERDQNSSDLLKYSFESIVQGLILIQPNHDGRGHLFIKYSKKILLRQHSVTW